MKTPTFNDLLEDSHRRYLQRKGFTEEEVEAAIKRFWHHRRRDHAIPRLPKDEIQ